MKVVWNIFRFVIINNLTLLKMKKILFMLLVFNLGFTQNVSTTIDEYNYLTQGYKIQLETGGDFKKGYQLNQFEKVNASNFEITYSYLIEEESKKAKAILIVIKKEKDKDDKIRYLCLPFNNKELFLKFYKDYESLGVSMGYFLNISMFNLLGQSLQLNYNSILTPKKQPTN